MYRRLLMYNTLGVIAILRHSSWHDLYTVIMQRKIVDNTLATNRGEYNALSGRFFFNVISDKLL